MNFFIDKILFYKEDYIRLFELFKNICKNKKNLLLFILLLPLISFYNLFNFFVSFMSFIYYFTKFFLYFFLKKKNEIIFNYKEINNFHLYCLYILFWVNPISKGYIINYFFAKNFIDSEKKKLNFLTIFLKNIPKFIIKILTGFSFLTLKMSIEIINLYINFKSCKQENITALIDNILLNVLVDFFQSHVNLSKDLKIYLDKKNIIFNPFNNNLENLNFYDIENMYSFFKYNLNNSNLFETLIKNKIYDLSFSSVYNKNNPHFSYNLNLENEEESIIGSLITKSNFIKNQSEFLENKISVSPCFNNKNGIDYVTYPQLWYKNQVFIKNIKNKPDFLESINFNKNHEIACKLSLIINFEEKLINRLHNGFEINNEYKSLKDYLIKNFNEINNNSFKKNIEYIHKINDSNNSFIKNINYINILKSSISIIKK